MGKTIPYMMKYDENLMIRFPSYGILYPGKCMVFPIHFPPQHGMMQQHLQIWETGMLTHSMHDPPTKLPVLMVMMAISCQNCMKRLQGHVLLTVGWGL